MTLKKHIIYSFFIFIGILFPLNLAGSLTLQHLVIAVLIFHSILNIVVRNSLPCTAAGSLVLAYIFLFTSILAVAFFGLPERLLEEYIKIIYITFGSVAFSYFFNIRQLIKLVVNSSVFLCAYIIFYIVTNDNIFTYGGRIEIVGLGSPNTLSFICSIIITTIVFDLFFENKSILRLVFFSIITIFLLWIMLSSSSRGGFFSMIGAWIGFLALNITRGNFRHLFQSVLFIVITIIALAIYLIKTGNIDAFTSRYAPTSANYDTGRLYIWSVLINNIFSNPVSLLIGFAPGSILVEGFGQLIYSAHSLYLSIFYYFGLIGIFSFICVLFLILKKIIRERYEKYSDFKSALLFLFLSSALVDNVLLASQAILYSVIVVSIFISTTRVPNDNIRRSTPKLISDKISHIERADFSYYNM